MKFNLCIRQAILTNKHVHPGSIVILTLFHEIWFMGTLVTELAICRLARLHGTVGSTSDSRARGLGFNTQSGHILLFPFLLIQEGQLSATCNWQKYVHLVLPLAKRNGVFFHWFTISSILFHYFPLL